MPIILELTDDQALNIVAQLGSLLSKKTSIASGKVPMKHLVASHIRGLKGGDVFYTPALAAELNTTTNKLSSVLTTLRKDKVVKMIRKGTWERI